MPAVFFHTKFSEQRLT